MKTGKIVLEVKVRRWRISGVREQAQLGTVRGREHSKGKGASKQWKRRVAATSVPPHLGLIFKTLYRLGFVVFWCSLPPPAGHSPARPPVCSLALTHPHPPPFPRLNSELN